MLDSALRDGKINSYSTVIEPTSGNTGIGLASICASMGLKLIIVMPDTMSVERRALIKAYGAQIVLTDGNLGMSGAIDKANELESEIPNSIIIGQFGNPANAESHIKTTGKEIWDDTDGEVDIFVCAVGTGGTISGTGAYLKKKNPHVRVVAVEPSESPFLSKGIAGSHKIQGIGAGFIPGVLDTDIYDEVIAVSDQDAYEKTREIARVDGVLVGISSGASLFAAQRIAEREENANKKIVVIFPDTGERYLSSNVF
jgi:cysteine synthase A